MIQHEMDRLGQMLMHAQSEEAAVTIENRLRDLNKEKAYINTDWDERMRQRLTGLDFSKHVAFFCG